MTKKIIVAGIHIAAIITMKEILTAIVTAATVTAEGAVAVD